MDVYYPQEPSPAPTDAPSAAPVDWRDPGIVTDQNKFLDSYYALRKEGLSREKAEESLARYVVGLSHPGTTDKDYDEAFPNVPPADILTDYLGLRDPGFFSTLAEGFGRGAISGGAAATGAYAGMRAGAQLGAQVPVRGASVVGGALGAAAGLASGALAGREAERAAFPETNVVPEMLPYLEAGKTVGGGLAGLPASTAAMRMISPTISQLFQNVSGLSAVTKGLQISGELARRAPGSFTTSQTPGAVGAGAGAFAAETFFPGDVVARMAGETATSLLYPGRILGGAAAAASEESPGIFPFTAKFLKGSQEKAASNAILNTLLEFKEDPQQLLKILSGAAPLIDPATGRQVNLPIEIESGFSPGLAALSNAAARRSGRYTVERDKAYTEAEVAYSNLIKALSNTGDPQAIQRAAEIQQEYANNLVASMITGALQRVQQTQDDAVRKLSPSRQPGDMQRLFGERVNAALEDTIKAWRDAEKKAFADADLTNVVGMADNIVDAWRKLRTDTLIPETEREVDPVVRNFITRVSGQEPNLEIERLYKAALARTDSQGRAIRATRDKYPAGPNSPSVDEQTYFWVGDDLPDPEDLRTASLQSLESTAELVSEKLGGLRGRYGDDDLPPGFPQDKGPVTQLLRQYVDLLNTEMDVRKYGRQLESFSPEMQPVSLNELQRFRSEMLTRAREAGAKNDFGKARIYGIMAEAALDDLGISEKALDAARQQGTPLSPQQLKLQQALAISRAGNDLFTRTFAGDITETARSGEQRILPELLAYKFLGSDNVSAQRMIQVEAALMNAPGVDPQAAQKRRKTVNQALDYLFRDEASKYLKEVDVVTDPTTQATQKLRLFDEAGLKRFLADNAEMLNLPALRSLRNDLRNIDTANGVLRAAQTDAGKIVKDNKTDAWFSKYLGGDSPMTAFAMAMGDPQRPETKFRQLLSVLSTVPTETLPGPGADNLERMRNAVRDNVLAVAQDKALRKDGTLDVQALRNALFRPLNPKGGPSVIDILQEPRYSVVTPEFRDKMNLLLSHLDSVQAGMQFRATASTAVFPENLAEQFLLRFAGANLGAAAAGGAPSLQTASFGAQLMRRAFEHIPTGKAVDLLALALEPTPEGKELFRRLLQRAVDERPLTAAGVLSPAAKAAERAAVRLVGAPIIYLPAAQTATEAGVGSPLEDQPLMPETVYPAPSRAAPPPPPPAPPPARTAPPPAPPAASPPAPRPGPRPAAPPAAAPLQRQGSVTSPEDRARFAALFPGDIVSSLL